MYAGDLKVHQESNQFSPAPSSLFLSSSSTLLLPLEFILFQAFLIVLITLSHLQRKTYMCSTIHSQRRLMDDLTYTMQKCCLVSCLSAF